MYDYCYAGVFHFNGHTKGFRPQTHKLEVPFV